MAPDNYTAQAIIITDAANNQITAFHPGAMMQAHEAGLPARSDIKLAIIGPDGRDAMIRRAADLAAAKIPFVFDPGQGLPMFDGADLRAFIAQATWVTVNDYEAKMLTERTGLSLAELSTSHLKGVIVTLGDQGCEVWEQGVRTHVPGVAATEVLDPDRLRRRLPRRAAVRPRTGLAADRLRGARQQGRRREDRVSRRAEPSGRQGGAGRLSLEAQPASAQHAVEPRAAASYDTAIATCLRRLASPRSTSTSRLGTPSDFASHATSASFARPSIGGAASRTRSAPSCRPSTSVRLALGITLS